MSRVQLLNPEQAEGRAREVFDRVKRYYHFVPALQQALGHLPETTDAVWTLSKTTATEGSIREELKRIVFAVTSYEVECDYCTAAHMLALFALGWSPDECVEVILGKSSSRLSDKDNAAVHFAGRVARRPASISDRDADTLRASGWSDAEIVEIIAAVALIRYTATVATATAVPLERAMEHVTIPQHKRED